MVYVEWLDIKMVKKSTESIMKVCMLGDPAVGKTSLVRRYVYDKFEGKYLSTIGTNVTRKVVNFENQNMTLTLMLWDVLGQHSTKFHPVYYKGAKGGILVCDVTRRETLDNLNEWVTSFFKISGKVPIIFLANKMDLEKERVVKPEELEAVSKTFDATFYMTSAKTGENVNNAFTTIATELLKNLN